MNLTFDEHVLAARAAKVLGPRIRLGPPGEHFFDPGLRLPHLPKRPKDLPSLRDVFLAVPDPYATRMQTAYVQMSNFAAKWCCPIGSVVYAEPFFEWMMHTDPFNPYYRDHIVHQVRVAAVGDMLLDERIGSATLLDLIVANLGRRLRDVTHHPHQFVRLAWWLAALFHDCGYPYERYCKHFSRLHRTFSVSIGRPTDTSWFSCFRNLANLNGPLDVDDIDNSEDGAHCFTSAAELLSEEHQYEDKAGKNERDSIRKRRRALFALAVGAIRLHHRPESSKTKTAFKANPLGFLLVLSDEIHELERPTTTFSRSRTGSCTEMQYTCGPVVSVEATTGARGVSARTLSLVYHCIPGTTHIRGKTRSLWELEKLRELERGLRLGRGEVLTRIAVQAR